jgi:hypothetical protein
MVGISKFFDGSKERHNVMDQLFQHAAEYHKEPGITSMKYNTGDRGAHPSLHMYSMSYHRHKPYMRELCGPDWTFHSWPSASIQSFEEEVEKIKKAGKQPAEIDKVGWYGNTRSGYGCVEAKTRPMLLEIGSQHTQWMDIRHVAPRGRIVGPSSFFYLSIPEMVQKYSVLLDIGGNGYSGRLKYLLYSNRPLLLVERDEIEYFHADLVPWTHFIPVQQDLSDLVSKIKWVFQHRDKCQQIATNAQQFANERFTRHHILTRILVVYQNYQNYDPKKYQHLSNKTHNSRNPHNPRNPHHQIKKRNCNVSKMTVHLHRSHPHYSILFVFKLLFLYFTPFFTRIG